MVFCLLNSPTYGMEPAQETAAIAGQLPRSVKTEQFDLENDLPYLFRVTGKPILLAGTEHSFGGHRIAEWFLAPILACKKLFLETSVNMSRNDPKELATFITTLFQRCGGEQGLLLSEDNETSTQALHPDFQEVWTQIATLLEPEGKETLSFLKNTTKLKSGFIAILNYVIPHSLNADIINGMDNYIATQFHAKNGEEICGLEDPTERFVPMCSVENMQDLEGNFNEEALENLKNALKTLTKIKNIEKMHKILTGQLPVPAKGPSLKEYGSTLEEIIKAELKDPTLSAFFAANFLEKYHFADSGPEIDVAIPVAPLIIDELPKVSPPSLVEKLAVIEFWASQNNAVDNRFLDPRNLSWIPTILNNLETPCAVVVGAGHLVGEKGLFALLQEQGLSLERCGSNGKWKPFTYRLSPIEVQKAADHLNDARRDVVCAETTLAAYSKYTKILEQLKQRKEKLREASLEEEVKRQSLVLARENLAAAEKAFLEVTAHAEATATASPSAAAAATP